MEMRDESLETGKRGGQLEGCQTAPWEPAGEEQKERPGKGAEDTGKEKDHDGPASQPLPRLCLLVSRGLRCFYQWLESP